MKIIRFRTWNGKSMEFGGGDKQSQLCICEDGAPKGGSGKTAQEIMLATGIKDQDANDVYEGDICRGKISIACVNKEIESGIVEYKPENARFELKCSDASLPLNMVSALKVIGHIHDDSSHESKSSTHCSLK